MRVRSYLVLSLVLTGAACSFAIDRELDGKPFQDPAGGGGGVGGGTGGGVGGGGGGVDGGGEEPCGIECDCTPAPECGEHMCSPDGEPSDCFCPAGYVEGESGCAWGGGIRSPGFDDAASWTTRDGVVIEEDDPGVIDTGLAYWNSSAICARAAVSQRIQMPSIASSEPLVVEIAWSETGSAVSLALGLDGHVVTFAPGETSRICLGEAGYGGDVELTLTAVPTATLTCSTRTMTVDRIRIVPATAGECPAGVVRNGDFEADGGWANTVGPYDGTVQIVAGIGTEGSRGLEIEESSCPYSPRAVSSMLVPFTDTPAVSFAWRSDAGANVLVGLDALTLHVGTGTGLGAFVTSTLCIPPWKQGLGSPIAFRVDHPNACGAEANLDDVAIVSAPACGTDPYLVDGGFELVAVPGMVLPWQIVNDEDATGAIIDDASAARTGNGVLALRFGPTFGDSKALAHLRVPASVGNDGPAVRFWYRTASLNGNAPMARVYRSTAFGTTVTLPDSAAWVEEVLCLEPGMAGLTDRVEFVFDHKNDATGAETFFVDDVSVGTSPDCPVP